MKFSIIVPIYNVKSYLEKCLDSIINQTYDNFEVILVNDGSTDESETIIDKYIKKDKRFKKVNKKNGGLSSARNAGIERARGDYLLFVDADDYINKYLLEKLDEEILTYPYDIVRFKISKVINNKTEKGEYTDIKDLTGPIALTKLITDPLFVTAWSQTYKKSFWDENKFQYPNGRLHEDFGLTPLVYLSANKVSSIDITGYYYVIREDSIMTSKNIKKEIIRNEDMIYHFNYLLEESKKINIDDSVRSIYNSFLANSIINRCKDLSGIMLKDYLKEIKKYNISSYLIEDTFMRKLKKICFKTCPKIYIKFYLK